MEAPGDPPGVSVLGGYSLKKLVFFIFMLSLFIILGCATVKKNVDYYNLCVADDECYSMMQANKKTVSSTVNTLGGDSILGLVAGNLASLLTGLVYGRKVGERKRG